MVHASTMASSDRRGKAGRLVAARALAGTVLGAAGVGLVATAGSG